ncbi:SCP2 sterol-binding domain-containing protein 1 isoform X2 [Mesocricetus auratus]|uniref:SCP2 sterol-binding domain-containing protein 1 isoform X2 n=1 Tax=Mesocricetus auratus TaxID=10036 RepID=A0A3Q0CUH3_MESAU|nr:SCP2 sterol-binding domain-containing protein 1 isoform X2 [Mesocricetus auratus]
MHRDQCRRGVDRLQDPERMDDSKETVSSKYKRTNVHMNPQRPWQSGDLRWNQHELRWTQFQGGSAATRTSGYLTKEPVNYSKFCQKRAEVDLPRKSILWLLRAVMPANLSFMLIQSTQVNYSGKDLDSFCLSKLHL